MASVSLALDCRAVLGESPVCNARGDVWFVDINGRKILGYDSVANRAIRKEAIATPQLVGCVVPRASGGLIAAMEDCIVAVDTSEGRVTDTLLSLPSEYTGPKIRFNDGKCDPAGRFWAGTMDASWRDPAAPKGHLFCISPADATTATATAAAAALAVEVKVEGTQLSNGLAWSADGMRLFFIDSALRTVDCFDFDAATAAISNRRTAVTFSQDEPGKDLSELYVTTREETGASPSANAGGLFKCHSTNACRFARRRSTHSVTLAQRDSRYCPPPCLRAALLVVRHPALPAMASLSVLTFDHEGRPIQFDTWLNDLQLYLLSDSRDSVSLFDHTSVASLAPPVIADSATRSQWLTHDAAARLAVRNHLTLAERAHFGKHKAAKTLYDAVVARYSSPATAALGHLIPPYLFPELSAFATVKDLITHLRTSETHYRGALAAEFLEKNPPPIIVTVGAVRGTPRTPFFKGCSPSPLGPSFASAAAVDIFGTEDVGAATALSGKRRSGKGKGGKSGGGGTGGGGGVSSRGGGGGGGGGSGGSGGGSGGLGGGGGGSGGGGSGDGGSSGSGGGGSGGSGSGGGRGGAVQRGGSSSGQRQQKRGRSETPTPQQLREWFAQRGASGGSVRCPYDIRTEFGDEAECPRWAELLRSGVDIFVLDYDAILAAIESALPDTEPAKALHTFTLDLDASRCFYHDSTTLTPLPAPVPVRLADPSGGPVLARSSTVLPCPTVPSGSLSSLHLPSFSTNLVSTAALQDAMVTTTTPGGQHVSISTCTRTGRHLATFTRQPRSSMYTLTTEPPQVAAFSQVSASGPMAAPCSRDLVDGEGRRCVGVPVGSLLQSLPLPHCPSPPPPPLFLTPGPPPVDPLPPHDPAPSSVSLVDPLPLAEPVEVTVHSGAARGVASWDAEPAGAEPGGAEPASAEPGGAEPEGAEPGGAESEGAESGGADPEGAEPGGAEPEGAKPGEAESEGAESRGTGAKGAGAASPGGAGVTAGAGGTGGARAVGPGGARTRVTEAAEVGGVGGTGAGDPGAGGAGAGGARAGGLGARDPGARSTGTGDPRAGGAGAGGVGAGGTGAGDPGDGGAGAGDLGARGAGAGDPRAGGPGVGGVGAGDLGAGGAGAAGGDGAGGTGVGGTVQRRPFFVPLPPSSLPPPDSVLRQILSLPSSTGLTPSLMCPPPHHSQPQLQPNSPLPAPSPYAEQTDSLTERRGPESRSASPVRAVCTDRRVPHPRPPPVPGTHIMTLRPSFVPLRAPLPTPPASSLADGPDPESDLVRAASPTVPHLLATVVTDPLFESAAAFALVAELVEFATVCRLDYVASLVADSESDRPPSVGGECASCTDVLEDRHEDFQCLATAVPRLVAMLLAPEGDPDAPDIPTPRSYAEAITDPYSSQWQTAMDAEMASWKSTGTYVDVVPPHRANIVDGMCVFRGVEFFYTFSPTLKMTTLRVLLHVAAQCDYELHSLDFSTAFLKGSLHEEIWLHRPPGFIESFPAGTQWSLRRPIYGLRQAPRAWHDTMKTMLVALGFDLSSADLSLFLRTDTTMPPFYVLVYVNDLVFAIADTEALALVKLELQKRHICTDLGELRSYLGFTSGMGLVLGGRGPVVLTGRDDASWVDDLATQRSSKGYIFSLVSGSISWRSTRSFSVLSSNCEAEIYAGAMDAQELRWLTYLLTDLGEQLCSPPVLNVDNKAMIALCLLHRLEHTTKHITLRYFLARELQQRGQLRLAYIATRANTADIFIKALQPGDHQPGLTFHFKLP
ncbi:unnamed protein product [Closterium sp. NIES-53]